VTVGRRIRDADGRLQGSERQQLQAVGGVRLGFPPGSADDQEPVVRSEIEG
jgi:hypothetical protein